MATKQHKHARRPSAPTACQRCGRRIPPVARKHRDPFCSRVCAEATYGTRARSSPIRQVARQEGGTTFIGRKALRDVAGRRGRTRRRFGRSRKAPAARSS